MTKILLDTDIGTDSDDAVCLCYLLLHPDCDLLGVTTVGLDAALRADIARKLCVHLDHPDLPVVSGADRPTLPNHYWSHHQVNQHTILDSPPEHRRSNPFAALKFMREVIRDNPEEVVLLTVGPTTNAALLAAADPETAAMLKGVHSMGGTLGYPEDAPETDCNIMLDPAAAEAVFARDLPDQSVVTVDTSGGMSLNGEETRELFAGDRLAPLRECCGAWIEQKGSGGTGLHDPLTAAAILHPHLFQWERGRIGITLRDYDLSHGFDLDDDEITGYTHFTSDEDDPHRVARGVDQERYREHLWQVFS